MEFSLYRSWAYNELLEVNNPNGVNIGTVNVPKIIHQGIELGLGTRILDSFMLCQSYTLNDFHFKDDPAYGDNRIGGIPIHLYHMDFSYETPSGFYAGPNLSCNLSHYPVDQADTLDADPYVLWGFKVGYRPKKGWNLFVEVKNLVARSATLRP